MLYNVDIINIDTLSFNDNIIQEGFKVKKEYSVKSKNKKLNTIKRNKKKDPYDNNIDYSLYGDNKFYNQFDKQMNGIKKLKNKNYKPKTNLSTKKENFKGKLLRNKKGKHSLLKELSNDYNPGSVDNFQDILDEIDSIDTNTFKFKNINSVASSYNDNLKNRLKYAEKKGYNSYERTIGKGSVLLDEFKKLMSYDSYMK